MATKLYVRSAGSGSDYTTGNNEANLRGTAIGWRAYSLTTSPGAAAQAGTSTNTVAGATPGVEIGSTTRGDVWYSPPLAAAVTISGAITWNLWASESSMSANVAINGRLEVIDGATGAITLIDQTVNAIEISGVSPTRTLTNFAETPAAGIACKKGDRLRVRIFGDDAGTMANGFTFTISTDGPTAAADGDSWLQLTENLTFVSEPAGTTIYPTDTASAVSTASVDREAWTSRGAGVQTDVTNTVAGYTAPIQVTDTAGGTVVDWFTRPLTAFTLGEAVRVNLRQSATDGTWGCEIASVAGDGTSPTVWGKTVCRDSGAPERAVTFLVAGADLTISAGQRIRIRVFIDDGDLVMAGGTTSVLYYAGTSGGASGDTYLTFTQTLTEYTSSAPTGTGAGTQTTQAGSATGAETFTGTGAGTGTAASASGSGSVGAAFGTGAGTGQAATASGTGLETITGAGSGSQAVQTASGSGLETITGTGAGTGTAASASGSGLETIATGTGAGTQTVQTATGSGLETITGTGTATGTAASATGSGLETITGTGAGTQTVQTASGTGNQIQNVSGTGAGLQAVATAAGSGLETITGTGAGTQTVQTATGTAAETITGSGAGTGTAASASGTALETFTSTGAGTQAPATAAGSALQTISGSGAGVQAPATASGSGLFAPAVTGTGAGLQAAATAVGTGASVAPGAIAGPGAGTQAVQTASGTGAQTITDVTGTGEGVQVPGSGDGTGTVGEVEVTVPGGGAVRTFYIPRGRVTGTGSGAQVAASARGRATVNDDELVLEALAA